MVLLKAELWLNGLTVLQAVCMVGCRQNACSVSCVMLLGVLQ